MKKQLPTHGITNELAGSSVFFHEPDTPESPVGANKSVEEQPSSPPATPPNRGTVNPRHHATKPSRRHGSVSSSHHAATPAPGDPGAAAAWGEQVRKAVKQLGKEAATHRFTVEEKTALADIVYTYSRQGYRTSENEITRIGVNWLLLDYQENGANSVLARLLDALHG